LIYYQHGEYSRYLIYQSVWKACFCGSVSAATIMELAEALICNNAQERTVQAGDFIAVLSKLSKYELVLKTQ
jgi:hypothetical protein